MSSITSTDITKAVVSSTGDPHIKITLDAGKQQVAQLKYNDQSSQKALVDTAELGGIIVSTETTPVNSKGVAYNQAVQIYDASGNVSVSISDTYGKTGEPLESVTVDGNLPKGVSVTEKDGKVVFKATDGDESFNVKVTQGKHGLNVKATATNVQIGGAAVNQLSGTLFSASA